MSGDHDKYFKKVVECDGVYLTPEQMNEIKDALYEAAYLLNPTDDDMQKEAGMYRVVTALEKLKEKSATEAEREWVGLTPEDIPDDPDPRFDTDEFLLGMALAEAILKEKNT